MTIRIRLLCLTGDTLAGARAVSKVFESLPRENVDHDGDWDSDRVLAAWQDIDKAQEWITEYSREAERFYGSYYLPSTVGDEHKSLEDYLPTVREMEKVGVVEFTTAESKRQVRCLPNGDGQTAAFQVLFGAEGSLRAAGQLITQVGESDKLRLNGLTLTPEELRL